MDTEIELKLVVEEDPLAAIQQSLLPKLNAETQHSQSQLLNHYFDTPERSLRKHDIGFRVRAKNGKFEQTVKLAGKSVAGLHSRPEYNVALDSDDPDLDLFETSIWPQDLDIKATKKQLINLFTTHFNRHQLLITFDNGDQIEVAIDAGKVKAGQHKQAIFELELELKKGSVSRIFELAEQILSLVPARLSNISKAARGYMLADGASYHIDSMPDYLPLSSDDTLETTFVSAIELALKHWQGHEELYLQEQKPKDLQLQLESQQLLLHVLQLFHKQIASPQIDVLIEQMQTQLNQWNWLDEFLSIKAIRSKKGQFRKRLNKQIDLLSYLRGRSEGLLTSNDPDKLIKSQANQKMQLAIGQLLAEQPWRNQSKDYQQTIKKRARKWLEKGWERTRQKLAKSGTTACDYLQSAHALRDTLQIGFLFGSLFGEDRDAFRAPWIDLLHGVEELTILHQLEQELASADIKEADELRAWAQDKTSSLLDVMHQSHSVALSLPAYW